MRPHFLDERLAPLHGAAVFHCFSQHDKLFGAFLMVWSRSRSARLHAPACVLRCCTLQAPAGLKYEAAISPEWNGTIKVVHSRWLQESYSSKREPRFVIPLLSVLSVLPPLVFVSRRGFSFTQHPELYSWIVRNLGLPGKARELAGAVGVFCGGSAGKARQGKAFTV